VGKDDARPRKRFHERLFAFENALDRVNTWILILGIACTVALVFTQVVLRRFFGHPLSWGEELARYMIVWSMFLAMGQGLTTGRFVGMEMLVVRMPPLMRKITIYVRHAVVIVFAWVVFSEGIKLVTLVAERGQMTPALGFRMAMVYSAIPIGSAILILKALLLVVKQVFGVRNPRSGAV